jgi:hypothetical protein
MFRSRICSISFHLPGIIVLSRPDGAQQFSMRHLMTIYFFVRRAVPSTLPQISPHRPRPFRRHRPINAFVRPNDRKHIDVIVINHEAGPARWGVIVGTHPFHAHGRYLISTLRGEIDHKAFASGMPERGGMSPGLFAELQRAGRELRCLSDMVRSRQFDSPVRVQCSDARNERCGILIL